MKKLVLGLFLALAALAFLVSPATAASSPQAAPVLSVADQVFVASLAVQVGTPAPVLATKHHPIGQKSFCSATANCANGGTISCTGTSSCTAVDGSCPEPGHVTCDGVTTSCSSCAPGCGPDWCNESACAANCSNAGCDYDYTCYDYPSCSDHCRCTRCVY